jgi:DDE superfamily endonuclease
MLLNAFLEILRGWDTVFPQARTTRRAIGQGIGSLICLGRRMLTRIIWAMGNEHKSWSSQYFLHSRSPWSADKIFEPMLKGALGYCRGQFIAVAMDDTSIKKTGTQIKQAFWSRDPMSPHFHVNLRRGIRFLQLAMILPLHKMHAAARTIPIRFEEVSAAKKPRKNRKDYEEKMKEYRQSSKIYNLPNRAVAAIMKVRDALDAAGVASKTLILVADAAFCNRTIFSYQKERTHLLVRCRKDLRLCRKSESAKRFYGETKFTPLQVMEDNSIAWKEIRIFYGGKNRRLQYKEVTNLFWETGARRRPLRLFVVGPTRYRVRKTGRIGRRQPGFLLSTFLEGHTQTLLQSYFDRWQIEVNHREEKDTLGIGQAQLHNYIAVPKQPALVVATYSALLLASLNAFGPLRTDVYGPLPRWRANALRPSCLDLVKLLRKEILENQQVQTELGIRITSERLIASAAA